MAEVASAVVALMPSFRGGSRAIAKELGGPLDRAGRDGGKRFGGGMRAGIAGIATRVFAPLAAAASTVALGAFFKNAINAAGDLEQSVGAVDAVFKKSADQVHDYAAAASGAVGLTANQYNEFATVLGAQLKNGGTSMDELAGKTNNLIGVGADLASMFGGTTSEAVDALSSALRGERDPIERYGVSLTQAAIDAEAASLGFEKVGGSLSQEANQAATLSLIMAQTADAHGNFARETDTFAGRVQILSSQWGDLTAKIGALFLPAATAAVGFISDNIIPAVDGIVSSVQGAVDAFSGSNLADSIGKAFGDGGFDGILAAAQTAFGALVDWLVGGGLISIVDGILQGRQMLFDAALQLFPQILNAAMTIIPQVVAWLSGTALPQLINVIVTTIPLIAQTLATLAPQLIQTLLSMVPVLLTAAVTLFTSLLTAILGILPGLIQTLVTFLPTLLTTIIGMLPQLLSTAVTLFLALVTAVVEVLPQLISMLLGTLLPSLLTTVLEMLPQLLETAVELFMSLLDAVMEILPELITLLIGTVLPELVSTLIKMVPKLLSTAIKIFTALLDGLIKVLPKINSWIGGTLIPTLISAVLAAGSKMLSAGKDVLGGFWDGVKDKFVAVDGWFRELPGRILSAIGNIGSTLLNAGRNLIGGFLDGIWEKFDSVRSTLSNLTDLLPDWKGPAERDATILKDAGQLVMGGFIDGLESQYANVRRTLQGLTGDMGNPTVTIGGAGATAAALAQRPGLQVGQIVAADPAEAVRKFENSVRYATMGGS